MKVHIQRSIYFHLIPRMRIYRRPWMIWLRWFGKSAYIDGASVVSSQGEVSK